MGLLLHLGFVPGNAADAVTYEAEHDEVVMLKGHPNGGGSEQVQDNAA
jgi:hypothetical protein